MFRRRGSILFLSVILDYLYATTINRCLPGYHPCLDYDSSLTDFERREFNRSYSGNYTKILLDISRNTVIVGGRNYVFMLTADNLHPIKEKQWFSASDQERCLQRGLSKMECQNIIQLMVVYQGNLLICGSNSLSPVFNITRLKNLENVGSGNRNGFGKCSPKPSHKVVGSVTDIGEVIAGTFGDTMGIDPMISGTFMTPKIKRKAVMRTERWNKRMLNDPEFIDSFAVYPSVYIFFNEKSDELNGEVYATVGRVCQGDNGGSDFVLENTWTTYRKARISCAVKDKTAIHFKLLRSVTWSEVTKTFYAVFTTSDANLAGSTVCAFSLKEIERTFDGDFLFRRSPDQPWSRTTNKKYFEGCVARKSSLIPATPELLKKKVPVGKEPTNFLKLLALTDAFYYQLMYERVDFNDSWINFLQESARFTQIAVDNIKGRNGTTISIIYLGTDYGSVVALYQPKHLKSACILQEIKLFKEGQGHPVKQIVISDTTKQMFIGTDVKFDRLKLYNCPRHKTRSACINARHPACGWDPVKKECTSFEHVDFEKMTSSSWEQDLTLCPSVKGTWSKWSTWGVCPQIEDQDKLCKCRERYCRSDNPVDCKGPKIEVKNCAVTKIEDVKSWSTRGVIHGGWSPYSDWSECGKGLCGAQFKTRTRSCTNPPPKNGGMACQGEKVECQPCGKREQCPPICGDWNEWSPCRNTSGVATKRRSRVCLGAKQCPVNTKEVRICKANEVVWGQWSECNCDLLIDNQIQTGVQHRIPACAGRCLDIVGCQRHLVQYRTCNCPKFRGPNTSQRVSQPRKEHRKFEITDIILTSVITGIACLVICAVVVTLFIKRSKSFLNISRTNERSGIDPEVLRTPIKKSGHVNGGPVAAKESAYETTPLNVLVDEPNMNSIKKNRNDMSSPSGALTNSPDSHLDTCNNSSYSESETAKI